MTREHLRTLVPSILSQYKDQYGLRDLPIAVDNLRPMMEERGWVDRIIWEEFDFKSQHIVALVEFFVGKWVYMLEREIMHASYSPQA
ncbi:MAG: hypothetical protein CGW95_02830 [Phenylobacterium zucineum]|nr:MAG: hypothetical protein CGW95_02830 [Phenylobacterium zucineum]